jgi:hypothetical protein
MFRVGKRDHCDESTLEQNRRADQVASQIPLTLAGTDQQINPRPAFACRPYVISTCGAM